MLSLCNGNFSENLNQGGRNIAFQKFIAKGDEKAEKSILGLDCLLGKISDEKHHTDFGLWKKIEAKAKTIIYVFKCSHDNCL